jgi:pyruvate carboxylase subunit B
MTESTEPETLNINGVLYPTRLTRKYRERKPVTIRNPMEVRAVIPGEIVEILVEPGQPVERGDGVLVLEAMKMRNAVSAAAAGTVTKIHVEPGSLVAKGTLLVELE